MPEVMIGDGDAGEIKGEEPADLSRLEEAEISVRVFIGIWLMRVTYHLGIRPSLWLLMRAAPSEDQHHRMLAMYDLECRYGGKRNARMMLEFGDYLRQADMDTARQKRLEEIYGEYVQQPDPNEIARPRRDGKLAQIDLARRMA